MDAAQLRASLLDMSLMAEIIEADADVVRTDHDGLLESNGSWAI